MGVRQLLQSRPWVGWVAAGAIVAGSGVYALRGSGGGPSDRVYFQELGTDAVFADSGAKAPPVTGPSGKPAVRARVFACGDCANAARFTGYLESNTPDGKRAQEQMAKAGRPEAPTEPPRGPATVGRNAIANGRIVAAPAVTPEWIPANTSEGDAVRQAALDR